MQKGFTLIELLVTISLVAILAVVAMPSFKSLITGNRMAAEINDFISSLHYTRTEAVKRGANVTICAANEDRDGCLDTDKWSGANGWIILTSDNDVVKSYAGFYSDRLVDVTPDGLTMEAGKIVFNRYGFAPGSARTVKLCDSSDDLQNARGVIISTSVRIILASDTDANSDDIRNEGSGENLECE